MAACCCYHILVIVIVNSPRDPEYALIDPGHCVGGLVGWWVGGTAADLATVIVIVIGIGIVIRFIVLAGWWDWLYIL